MLSTVNPKSAVASRGHALVVRQVKCRNRNRGASLETAQVWSSASNEPTLDLRWVSAVSPALFSAIPAPLSSANFGDFCFVREHTLWSHGFILRN